MITYALTITLPEGTTPSLKVIDNLPLGLAYIVGSSTVDTTGFAGSVPAPTVTASGSSGADVTFDFGTISVTGDNNPANNSFSVRFRAVVLDVPGNIGLVPPGQTS